MIGNLVKIVKDSSYPRHVNPFDGREGIIEDIYRHRITMLDDTVMNMDYVNVRIPTRLSPGKEGSVLVSVLIREVRPV